MREAKRYEIDEGFYDLNDLLRHCLGLPGSHDGNRGSRITVNLDMICEHLRCCMPLIATREIECTYRRCFQTYQHKDMNHHQRPISLRLMTAGSWKTYADLETVVDEPLESRQGSNLAISQHYQ